MFVSIYIYTYNVCGDVKRKNVLLILPRSYSLTFKKKQKKRFFSKTSLGFEKTVCSHEDNVTSRGVIKCGRT